MKTRQGFVSNSSSSSFIIVSDKRPEELELKLNIKFKASQISDETIESEEELIKYFIDCYCYDDEGVDEIKKKKSFQNYLKYLKEGKKLIFCEVTDEDGDPLEVFLYNSRQMYTKEEGRELVLPDNTELLEE